MFRVDRRDRAAPSRLMCPAISAAGWLKNNAVKANENELPEVSTQLAAFGPAFEKKSQCHELYIAKVAE